MKRFLILVSLALAAWAAPAQEAVPPLLPVEFSGWTKAAPSQAGTDPRLADPSAPALLREFGFTDFESSTYRREGRVFTVRAARFADASGAYGAFTHYKLPQMLYEEIGEQGASADRQVLFYKGNVLVTAMLDKVTAMSAGELRTLAAALPQLSNRESTSPPTLPTYLPKRAYIKNSARYVVGPVGLAAAQAPLPPALVDFSVSPEVVLGRYHTSSGDATLVLISYPTPQIAAEHLKSIEASALQTPPREAPQPDARPNPPAVAAKRSGPLVVVVSGDLSADEAKSLLAAVNYDAEVTWNENTFLSKRDNIGNLLMAIFTLVGFLLAFALVMGVAFGGVRILAKRMFPDKVFDRSEDVEIIQLNLRK